MNYATLRTSFLQKNCLATRRPNSFQSGQFHGKTIAKLSWEVGGVDTEQVNKTSFQSLENFVSGIWELRTELKITLENVELRQQCEIAACWLMVCGRGCS